MIRSIILSALIIAPAVFANKYGLYGSHGGHHCNRDDELPCGENSCMRRDPSFQCCPDGNYCSNGQQCKRNHHSDSYRCCTPGEDCNRYDRENNQDWNPTTTSCTTSSTWGADNPWTTSTVYSTATYTITDCPATYSSCPAHYTLLTTSIIPLYTTVCPITQGWTNTWESTWTNTWTNTYSAPVQTLNYITSTVYSTSTYTFVGCPSNIPNCPGSTSTITTTSLIPVSTTICPITTTVYPVVQQTYVPPVIVNPSVYTPSTTCTTTTTPFVNPVIYTPAPTTYPTTTTSIWQYSGTPTYTPLAYTANAGSKGAVSATGTLVGLFLAVLGFF